MRDDAAPGQIVILNGAPRSGKSSIVVAIQETLEGTWMNIGVDVARAMTPLGIQPGIGLRPGEVMHPAAPFVPHLYAALYESVAAHSGLGLNVAVDVGHHDVQILADAARRLTGLPVLSGNDSVQARPPRRSRDLRLARPVSGPPARASEGS